MDDFDLDSVLFGKQKTAEEPAVKVDFGQKFSEEKFDADYAKELERRFWEKKLNTAVSVTSQNLMAQTMLYQRKKQ